MAQCPNCGTQAPGKFCPNCGAQVPQASPTAAAAMQPQQGPPPVPGYPQQGQPPQYGAPTPPGYQAPYPNPYQQAPAPKQGSSALKIVLIVVGALVGLFVLLIGAAMVLVPDDDPTVYVPRAASTAVSLPVITDQVDPDSQKPLNPLLTVPSSTDSIYAAVEVNVKKGQVLGAKWYYQDRLQEHLNTDLEVPSDYSGWASFDIGNGGKPWPPARYRVEIYLDGVLQQSVNFTVK